MRSLVHNLRVVVASLFAAIAFSAPQLAQSQSCTDLDGAYVLAGDGSGKYLGFFGNSFASDSIMNTFGLYGSTWGINSVRNTTGTYGGAYSQYSASNSFAQSPPVIYKYGIAQYFLTTNSFKNPRVTLAAIDSGCNFFSSVPAGAISLPAAPSAVSAADGISTESLAVAWTAATGATSYNVYISTTNSNYQLLGNVAGTSTSISALSSGVTYYVAVTGVNSAGESNTYRYDTGYLATPVTSFTVNPSTTGNGSINPGTAQSVGENNTAAFTLTPATDYQIASVTGTCGGSLVGTRFTTNPITANCTVIGAFEPIPVVTFDVTPSSDANGSIAPSSVQTVNENQQVQFDLTPANGYRVAAVGGSCGGALSGNTFTTNPITADCTVEASHELIPLTNYTVTPSSGAGGSISPNSAQSVAEGSTASFTITPDGGYQIDSVGGTCGGSLSFSTYTTNAVAADCTVAASFFPVAATIYTVTPSAGPNGSITPSTAQSVEENLQVQFTMTPAAGYRIANVAGTCGGTLSGNTFTTDEIVAACTVAATFELNQECPNAIYSFNTQAEVDALGDLGCNEIMASLTIRESTDITNLDGLANITSVAGKLDIYSNDVLTNLDGLANLTSVGGYLRILHNYALTNLDGLAKLTSVGDYLTLQGNDVLTNFDGLANLTSVGGRLYIQGNDALKNLDGLRNLSDIGDSLIISFNGLTNLDGLASITSVGSLLQISYNDALINVDGLANITSVAGNLDIHSNHVLTNLDGLANLTSVGGYLDIRYNALTNLDGLAKLTSVGDYLHINNNALPNLDGLANCQGLAPVLGWPNGPPDDAVVGSIEIRDNWTGCNSAQEIIESVTGSARPLIDSHSTSGGTLTLPFSYTADPDALFPVTVYQGVCASGSDSISSSSESSPLVFEGVERGKTYSCTVTPIIKLGSLPASAAYTVAVPLEAPSAPTITFTDYEDGTIILRVSVSDNGGAAITGYEASCSDGEAIVTAQSSTSPITITGLTNDTPYTCSVTATNSEGISLGSAATDPITPEEISLGLPIWLLYQATQ
ncbi:hypothetical protein N9C62_00460 [Luminiphilus sp.]|nr:hypothetical protein [Luminiphilus sp.]